jgi:hypothetical protein
LLPAGFVAGSLDNGTVRPTFFGGMARVERYTTRLAGRNAIIVCRRTEIPFRERMRELQ